MMDVNLLRSLVTVVSLLLFIGLLAWVWWPSRRASLNAQALTPFLDDGAQGLEPATHGQACAPQSASHGDKT